MSSRRPLARRIALITALTMVIAAMLAPAGSSAAATSTGFRLPYKYGTDYNVNQGWGGSTSHTGDSQYAYDFGMPEGTPVLASARGTVKYRYAGSPASRCGGSSYINDANYVVLYHADGSATIYAHLSRVDVALDQVVAPGQQLGLSGKTGYTSCGPHLHFARQEKGGPFTQSIPIYFEEKPGGSYATGANPVSQNPECSQSTTALPTGSFCAKYFDGNFSGPEYFSRREYPLSFSWPSGTGGGYWLDDDSDFSARWVGKFTLAAGTYDFSWRASDGIRLYIDNMTTPVWSSWVTRSTPASGTFSKYVSTGTHTIKVEFDDVGSGEAAARMVWTYNCDFGGAQC